MARKAKTRVRSRRHVVWALFYVVLITTIVVINFPVFWMFITSIRPQNEIFSRTAGLIPSSITLEHYGNILRGQVYATLLDFPAYFTNSLVVALGTTISAVSIATFAGYSLARYRYWARDFFANSVLFVYMFPSMLMVIPLLLLIRNLGLFDTRLSLIIVNTTFALPFAVWMLNGYFQSIPRELEESALVDGCTRVDAIIRIVFPLAAPGVVATAIYAFVLSWNELLYALVFINSEAKKTLPVGVAGLIYGDVIPWGGVMAASVLTALPVAILFMILQTYLVRGITAGAVKG